VRRLLLSLFAGVCFGLPLQLLPLLTLGEIGRRADVSGQEGLEAVLLKAFDSPRKK